MMHRGMLYLVRYVFVSYVEGESLALWGHVCDNAFWKSILWKAIEKAVPNNQADMQPFYLL